VTSNAKKLLIHNNNRQQGVRSNDLDCRRPQIKNTYRFHLRPIHQRIIPRQRLGHSGNATSGGKSKTTWPKSALPSRLRLQHECQKPLRKTGISDNFHEYGKATIATTREQQHSRKRSNRTRIPTRHNNRRNTTIQRKQINTNSFFFYSA
jgi:hypothetical protein